MKKILILILITVLMLLSCKNNSTNVDTSQDNNENSNNNNNNNNGSSTVTPEELEKYGIDIATATTKTIEEALIKYESDHKGEYKLIFKGNSTAQYDFIKGSSIAGLINEISLKDINITITFEYVNFPNNTLNPYILGGGQNLNKNIVKVILPDTITTIGHDAFNCNNLQNINMPKNLQTIEDSAFFEMKMKELILPDGLTTIGKCAFRGCTFTNLIIPDSVTSIGEEAFESCANLIKVKLPNSIKTLERKVFGSCNKLKSITIPASVKEIKIFAFHYAEVLETVTFLSQTPPTIGDYVFNGTALKTFYVPSGSKTEYEKLKGKSGIPDTIEIIEQ
ncbi:leucine-rich repeat protein [Brachyspira pilosicoli]|uniref:leucine-rich repeat domain-containing protein n=1 Tax=Brachyspira pilosicoli TaxID=52584 RepID=UPI0030072F61